ncbi:hypothetical protein VIM7927_01959 [Vibrio mangrovi]|uniref:Uncharacterized protein n=1 Tax=Vibrio mangrovi TaxID=474394 RepID=A0A1Y6IV42_9VIBR|nr:hypothetical protein VIM7927_01959 [Vibrio mangrovi]
MSEYESGYICDIYGFCGILVSYGSGNSRQGVLILARVGQISQVLICYTEQPKRVSD